MKGEPSPNCGGLAYPPVFYRDTEYRGMGGARRHRRSRRGRGKKFFSRRRPATGRRSRQRKRRTKRRVAHRRRRTVLRGGYAADPLIPQQILNTGRSMVSFGSNLAHNYMGTPISPSPYPTSQSELRPMVDVHFPDPPKLEQIALSAAKSAEMA